MNPDQPFTAPWQAEAFAMVAALLESGRLAPADWATALGAARASHAPDDGADAYWADWLSALEQLAPSLAPAASP
jgi:nitrile hydratase accessory protein